MDIDLDRWRALLDAERDAADAMPQFLALQDSQTRLGLARNSLARFRAAEPQGSVGGSLPRAAHAGERILDGVMGIHGQDDITKAFDSSVRELEARVAAAEHDTRRLELRHRQCAERLATLRQLVEATRQWAADQGLTLPGDDGRFVPPPDTVGATSVRIAGPPAGTPSFISPQPTRPSGNGTPPSARGARSGVIARMMQGLMP